MDAVGSCFCYLIERCFFSRVSKLDFSTGEGVYCQIKQRGGVLVRVAVSNMSFCIILGLEQENFWFHHFKAD